MSEPDNHMTSREDLPTQSELSIALDKASQRLVLIETLYGVLENTLIDLKKLGGCDTLPYKQFLSFLGNDMKLADSLFEIAYARFTTGKIKEGT